MDILEKIISNKRVELVRQKEAISLTQLKQLLKGEEDFADNSLTKVSFKESLLKSDTGIIAEFKRKSPSKGWIFGDALVEEVVPAYELSGASAVSVLTDELFFGGSMTDLKIARQKVALPLLRKDFIIDEYQLYQAKILGANVILLIASALTLEQSKALSATAQELELEVLLEIHSEEELAYLEPNIDVVGINNRNLSTFETNIQLSFDLGELIPDNFVKISESGISQAETVCELRKVGFQGFLMGENFMKTENPGKSLEAFIQKVRQGK